MGSDVSKEKSIKPEIAKQERVVRKLDGRAEKAFKTVTKGRQFLKITDLTVSWPLPVSYSVFPQVPC